MFNFIITIDLNDFECFYKGIDRPQPGFKPLERIQETGQRLARLAKELGVPFEFHAIADKWETITPAHLFLRKDEVLGVNCALRFRHMMDESIIATSPRTMLLNKIRSMNPKVHLFVNFDYLLYNLSCTLIVY